MYTGMHNECSVLDRIEKKYCKLICCLMLPPCEFKIAIFGLCGNSYFKMHMPYGRFYFCNLATYYLPKILNNCITKIVLT